MKKDNLIKSLLTLIIMISILISNITYVQATITGRISSTTGVKLRSGAGASYSSKTTVPYNTTVTINTQNVPTSDSSTDCSTGLWHNITYGSYSGYVCSRYIADITDNTTNEEIEIPTSNMATMTDEEFDDYLNQQGFPESYKTKLKALHKLHPNWVFVGIKTRASWSSILSSENVSGRSLYQSTSSSTQGYLSTTDGNYNWYADTFIAKDGSTWYQANSEAIAYYMDPRNFLTESGIFMFEDLNYYSSYQTSNAVKIILNSDFYTDLIQYYMEAATTYNVSPIYLAALSRQEVGLTAGYATSGSAGTYCNNNAINNHYNFYNIQATSGSKPVCNGLSYAVTKGWDTKQKAIVGGANWIVSGYIDAGQNTAYFQKWNTSINATKGISHQYMTNIKAVASSAATTKSSYNSMRILDLPFVFQIPIYSGIPDSTSLPATGNPNNWLKTLTVNGTSVTNFDSADTDYTITVPTGTTSVTIAATTINANAKTSGTGTITLTNATTKTNIIVTAQNGATKTYTITINKVEDTTTDDKNNNDNNNEADTDNNIEYLTPSETLTDSGYKLNNNTYVYNIALGSTIQGIITKLQTTNPYASINITNSSNTAKTSGSLATGDKITIVSDGVSQTYIIVIYGDINGDSEITTLDLLIVQKHILKKTTLTNAYLKAADVNKDGNVTTLDLLLIQKHLLKKSNISQS